MITKEKEAQVKARWKKIKNGEWKQNPELLLFDLHENYLASIEVVNMIEKWMDYIFGKENSSKSPGKITDFLK